MVTPLKAPCDEGVIAAGAADGRCAPGAGPWVLAATILGSSMAFIDGTAVNVLLLVARHVPESRDEQAVGGLDWWGALLAALGLGSTVYGLTVAADGGLGQPAALGWLAVGLGGLGLFLLRE